MDFKYQVLPLWLVLTSAVFSAVIGCGSASTSTSVQNASTATPPPAAITPADLAKLRWIEGSWRGTGDVEAPFYERYRFENDTTLAVDSFDDEKFSKVTETSRFELKDGRFGNGGEGARWVATVLDDNGITFEPVAKARNSFRWQKETPDVWKAILKWPQTDKAAARERIYKMERWPPAGQ